MDEENNVVVDVATVCGITYEMYSNGDIVDVDTGLQVPENFAEFIRREL